MPRRPNPKIAERNRIIIEDYQAGEGLNCLAVRHGLEPQSVRKILHLAGALEPRRAKRQRQPRPEGALSALHRQVGARIAHARNFDQSLSRQDMAVRAGMSEPRLRKVEEGIYSPSLLELERLAMLSGIPLTQLLGASNA